jgi:hypothetical protein
MGLRVNVIDLFHHTGHVAYPRYTQKTLGYKVTKHTLLVQSHTPLFSLQKIRH